MSNCPDLNFPAFQHAAQRLRALGYLVEDPSEKGIVYGWEWADYLKYDLKELLGCDGVATLEGWEKSRGAQLEVHVARSLDLPVMTVDLWGKLRVSFGYELPAGPVD